MQAPFAATRQGFTMQTEEDFQQVVERFQQQHIAFQQGKLSFHDSLREMK